MKAKLQKQKRIKNFVIFIYFFFHTDNKRGRSYLELDAPKKYEPCSFCCSYCSGCFVIPFIVSSYIYEFFFHMRAVLVLTMDSILVLPQLIGLPKDAIWMMFITLIRTMIPFTWEPWDLIVFCMSIYWGVKMAIFFWFGFLM